MQAIGTRAILVGGAVFAFTLFFAGYDVGRREYPAQPLLYAAGILMLVLTAVVLYFIALRRSEKSDDGKKI